MPGFAQSKGTGLAFLDLSGWMNTGAPVTLDALRGKVVLINFWTYSCINSRRPMVYLKRWHSEYGPLGLQTIGVHSPEFNFEHARTNVESYVREEGILFPIAQDNKFRTWDALDNQAWPGFYLLDRHRHMVSSRQGEDHAYEIEMAIRNLLNLPSTGTVKRPDDDPDLSRIGSPELYFGTKHPTPQDRRQTPQAGEVQYLYDQASPSFNRYLLDGVWLREEEPLVLRSSHGGLRLSFSAADLHLVADAPTPAKLRIRLNGQPMPNIVVNRPTL